MQPIVIDTNVFFSGLWQPAGPSARVMRACLPPPLGAGALVPVYDLRALAEYRDVLRRPHLVARVGPDAPEQLLAAVTRIGIHVGPMLVPYPGPLPDETDRPFVELALSTGAVLVTGNARDYPPELAEHGIEVVAPADMVRRLGI